MSVSEEIPKLAELTYAHNLDIESTLSQRSSHLGPRVYF